MLLEGLQWALSSLPDAASLVEQHETATRKLRRQEEKLRRVKRQRRELTGRLEELSEQLEKRDKLEELLRCYTDGLA